MVLVCVLLVCGLIVVNTRGEVAHERSVVSANLQRVGNAESGSIYDSFDPQGSTLSTLQGLASQPAIASAGPGCHPAIASIQSAVDGTTTDGSAGSLFVIDSSGTVLCTAVKQASLAAGSRHFAGAAELRSAIAAGLTGTGPVFKDPSSGELMMFTAVPLVKGRTALVFMLDSQNFLKPFDAEKSVTYFVADAQTGQVLMHYPALKGVLGTAVPEGVRPLLTNGSRVRTATGPDGVRRLYRSVRIKSTHLQLMVGISEAQAYAAARAGLRRNLLIGLGMLVVLTLLGYILQRRIGRPARRLQAAIHALASDPEAPYAPTSGPTELAAVAATFNATADARRKADGLSRAILQHASDHLLVVHPDGFLSFVAPAAERALGLHVGDDLDAMLSRLHQGDRERVRTRVAEWLAESVQDLELEARVYDSHGVLRSLDVTAQDLRSDATVGGVVLTGRDVTERRAFEEHLAHQARHDPLTGLANRAAVIERLSDDLSDPTGDAACVFFVDLDRFKLVNDSHGHAVGDQVLVALAHKLTSIVAPSDLVGRFGGDEFVVVTRRVASAEEAEVLASSIRRTMEQPLLVGRRELFVSGSVGIAMAEPGDAPDAVLRNADTAMYRAKAAGRNCSAFFDGAMRAEAQRLLRTESDLHRALERDQLTLHFQPIVNLADQRVSGVEALVRWNHPYHGLVPPGDFIPVAEESGLVVPIGAWVLDAACQWAADTSAQLGRPIRVSVNVSPRQLAQPDLVHLVDEVLGRTGLDPSQLCLEVTESVLVQDAHVAERALTALHDRGIRLSIDDFGTGWSSLTYLQQFPVDEIKLDRSYVSKVDTDHGAAAIVGALVGMAHTMGMTVTAEGVETEGQRQFLQVQRCDTAQGYLFARPMPGEQVLALLAEAGPALPSPRAVPEQERSPEAALSQAPTADAGEAVA